MQAFDDFQSPAVFFFVQNIESGLLQLLQAALMASLLQKMTNISMWLVLPQLSHIILD